MKDPRDEFVEQYIRDLKADGACSCLPVIKAGHVYHEHTCVYVHKPKKHGQTWWGSIVEAKTNIAVGFCIAYVANLVVLPLFGVTGNDPVKNLGITGVYTAISVIRQLVVRRFFNNLKWGHHK